jgi:hypothetical protein
MKPPAPVSVANMADLVAELIRRCTMRDGVIAATSQLVIEADDVRVLKAIEVKLFRLAEGEAHSRMGVRR